MKQYNLFDLIGSLKNSLLSYICSSLPLGNHASQSRLGEEFYRRLQTDTFQGPFLETVPLYKKTTSPRDLFDPNAGLNPEQRRFLDFFRPRFSEQDEVEALHTRLARLGKSTKHLGKESLKEVWERPLYEHQNRAFTHLISNQGNLVVATGTGSGKTECFLLALFYWLLTEPDEIRRQPGVRALLLYPLNALVEDQMRRLRELLSWINGQSFVVSPRFAREITFGRYVGTTRIDPNDRSPERSDPEEHISGLGEMLYRKDMQLRPPDILITNFTMLEYMLLRNDDKKLFSRPDLFRVLVLDEIHTYRGTQGMEVACLLRRFDDLLRRKAGRQVPNYVRVGLSGTLPDDPRSRKAVAKFASDLFGATIQENSIITEPPVAAAGRAAEAGGPWPQAADELVRLLDFAPAFCTSFGLTVAPDRPDEPDEIPLEEWQLVAAALESSFIPSEQDAETERVELLGRVLMESPIVQRFQKLARQEGILLFDWLASCLFGNPPDAARQERALAVLLQLVCAGRVQDQPLLPLRAHFFVKEQREAQLCVKPSHAASGGRETDGWWTKLFLIHHSTCDDCGGIVFPINLCRRCGFVLLEGWLRGGFYFPERDGLMPKAEFTRVLFRPLSGIADDLQRRFQVNPPNGTQIQEFRLCLKCGSRIFTGPHGDAAAKDHRCGQVYLIPILEWSSPERNVRIFECPHCEQKSYREQEVFTPPALSPYGAATVLLEETKRALDAPLKSLINKILCFSDSRQQAAKIARRLGRTNEDFTFRQLVFQALQRAPHHRLSTRALLDSILDMLTDVGLASLFCERWESARDWSLLKSRIATLLLRELCTEYQTLERMGVARVSYPRSLGDRAAAALASHWLGARLSAEERDSFSQLLLDWIFRFNWAVLLSAPPIEYERLNFYGYADQTVALRSQAGGPIGFCMKQTTSRSRRWDFYLRVSNRFPVLQGVTDLPNFNNLATGIWTQAICHTEWLTRDRPRTGPDPTKPFVILRGTGPENYQLKLNFEAITWRLTGGEEALWRCIHCQFVTAYNVANLCPVRACAGRLEKVTLEDLKSAQFSPSRHYIALVTEREPKPVWVEEHTAQLSPKRRAEIEKEFKEEEGKSGSLDVISASTTFELGVDLGTINSIFLANLPPEVSNYRQRAGRAGRRPGMLPFILSYVRERPHDEYFWANVRDFIGGVLRVPWLAPPSKEILLRHANAVIFARLLELYPNPSRLEGPCCGDFASFCLHPNQRDRLRVEAAANNSELAQSLRAVVAMNLDLSLTQQKCVAHFIERVDFANSTYFTSRSDDGSIPVFSDYSILPSYSFPLYVDELALYQKPKTESPRGDLKLQRDRRIALREYFPGRLIEADKWVIQTVGLGNGYSLESFGFCSKCRHVSRTNVAGPCTGGCDGRYRICTTIIPKGGFLGQVLQKPPPVDPELFEIQTSDIIFDPASDPPPQMESRGSFLRAASQSAAKMQNARMRMFSPRPWEKGLGLVESLERDVAGRGRTGTRCLLLPEKASNRQGQPGEYHLMHEFTTDIVRLQFTRAAEDLFLRAIPFQQLTSSPDSEGREKARTIFLFTLGQALATGAARHLQIHPAELDFTFRDDPVGALNTEFILFDTAPGGAGYATKCFEPAELQGVFREALQVLTCRCGDSCYGCLRSYNNQWKHARLNRTFVRDGLEALIKRNW